MLPIIYDVAVSVDGFIAGPSGDISQFAHDGPVVADYYARLTGYSVAIMGRDTYEFGYRFGMEPGQNPYDHMRTLVFSKSMRLPKDSKVELRRSGAAEILRDLKVSSDGPIYLCGGGAFAGSLLAMGLIDKIRLKRAPVVIGNGVRLFGESAVPAGLHRVSTRQYDSGYLLEEFDVVA